jgi:hypothetical protein
MRQIREKKEGRGKEGGRGGGGEKKNKFILEKRARIDTLINSAISPTSDELVEGEREVLPPL